MADLRRIAVIGAGRAGLDFMLRCLAAGCEVTLEDVMPSRLRRAQDVYAALPDAGPGKLHVASTVEDAVRQADIAIDFVPDELESKLEIFSMLDRMAPPATILCTPTSALSIADLASCTYRPQLCFGLRLAEQAGHLAAAELIRTSTSSPDALRVTCEWLESLGLSVTVKDDPLEQLRANALHPSVAASTGR
ncbi:MAG TPA: 3-hydroxyacyl-CoA dehydrogenase NAD-binding domain-containing protein [Acidobacteriaceae bacterium]|nr:3-hydroxyacyl-CoA dehydrogenase NAD-binding domain-containing protein [Acidobacteriaceae bacterium]